MVEPLLTPHYVYIVEASEIRRIKIGFSFARPDRRIAGIQTSCPSKLGLLRLIHGGRELESEFHSIFRVERTSGEWFRASRRLRHFIELLEPLDVRKKGGPFLSAPVRGIERYLDEACRNAQAINRWKLSEAGLQDLSWRDKLDVRTCRRLGIEVSHEEYVRLLGALDE